ITGEGTLFRQLHTARLPAPHVPEATGDGTPGSLFWRTSFHWNNHSGDLTSHEYAIKPEEESPARFLVGLFTINVFAMLLFIINFPIHHNRALLAFADVAAKFISLPQCQPKRRNVLRCRKEKNVNPPIWLLANKIAWQSD